MRLGQNTQGGRPCQGTGRSWPSIIQVKKSSLRGTNSASILISDFQPPDLRDNIFLLFKPFGGIWCINLSKRIHGRNGGPWIPPKCLPHLWLQRVWLPFPCSVALWPTTELWEACFPQTGGRLWLEGSLSAWLKVHCSVPRALPKLRSKQCQACLVVCLLIPSLLWFPFHFISSKCLP